MKDGYNCLVNTRKVISSGLLILLLLSLAAPVLAQAGSAQDLINEVNSYRAANGLAAFQVDGGLMELAQSHSGYQASIQTCTHIREDGNGPASYGIWSENIACGPGLSVQGAVYGQWTDSLHTSTMLGPDTGLVGAGVAFAGDMVYYTLAVKRLSGSSNARGPANSAPQQQATNTPDPAGQPLSVVATLAPNEDGSITHIVRYGEILIDIAQAYGITLDELYARNRSLDPRKPVYYEGQILVIRPAFTPTPFMTETYTPLPPTNTLRPTRTPRPTSTVTTARTPTQIPHTRTPTPTPAYRIPTLDDLGTNRPMIAYALIIVSAIGLVVLAVNTFFSGKR